MQESITETQEAYMRPIRIECKPGSLAGVCVAITDRDTGELIPHVVRATIHLDATAINTAELTYYEADAQGKLIVKDDELVARTVTVEHPQVDITAMERRRASIGSYKCGYRWESASLRKAFLSIGIGKQTFVRLSPGDALELLTWLEQERANLEHLVRVRNEGK